MSLRLHNPEDATTHLTATIGELPIVVDLFVLSTFVVLCTAFLFGVLTWLGIDAWD